uniref:Uncharacterized protein n=1 Tax=Amphimedon queenslandica TaxID=400682 RepID=A0A1X7V9R5_AMPQE
MVDFPSARLPLSIDIKPDLRTFSAAEDLKCSYTEDDATVTLQGTDSEGKQSLPYALVVNSHYTFQDSACDFIGLKMLNHLPMDFYINSEEPQNVFESYRMSHHHTHKIFLPYNFLKPNYLITNNVTAI